jgi:hypothetical protein
MDLNGLCAPCKKGYRAARPAGLKKRIRLIGKIWFSFVQSMRDDE